ncbi:MAG: hypothetical protein IID14_09740 [Candidatus Marinimicrobia bacterium]|nr:hypothetical protein [Candidatus Neomarinimicrobiota bacterium]
MVRPIIKRRAAKGKSTRPGAGKRGTASDPAVELKEQPVTTREIMVRRLVVLTEPIMEQYGQAAFDEVMTRMETTLGDFSEEVSTLFTEMVHQSREEHERLKAMLVQDEAVEAADTTEEGQEDAEMSEFEKRLARTGQASESNSASATND